VWLIALAPARALAESRSTIVVLSAEAQDATHWPEGTQAVVAELLTTGFGLVVRRAHSTLASEFTDELRGQLDGPDVTGAVAVFRQGQRGIAWVYDRRFGLEQVEVEVGGGPLATSRFVLRIVELLRNVDIEAQQSQKPASPPTAPPSHPSSKLGPARFWLNGGATLAAGLDAPLPLVAGSAAVGVLPQIGLELTAAFAPSSAPATTQAGDLRLRAQQICAFVTFDPHPRSRYGFVLGLGGGMLWAQATAQSAPGYEGHAADNRVGLASARARAFMTWGHLQANVTLDPGLLVPSLDVTAAGERALLIGRPWLALSAGIGMAL
jgi:hypothetical protein